MCRKVFGKYFTESNNVFIERKLVTKDSDTDIFNCDPAFGDENY